LRVLFQSSSLGSRGTSKRSAALRSVSLQFAPPERRLPLVFQIGFQDAHQFGFMHQTGDARLKLNKKPVKFFTVHFSGYNLAYHVLDQESLDHFVFLQSLLMKAQSSRGIHSFASRISTVTSCPTLRTSEDLRYATKQSRRYGRVVHTCADRINAQLLSTCP